MEAKVSLDIAVSDDFLMVVSLDLFRGMHISEPSTLIEVPAECYPGLLACKVATGQERAALDNIVSAIETRSSKILVAWVDFELFIGINGSDSVLPYVSHEVIELSSFESVNWAGGHPVLPIDIPN